MIATLDRTKTPVPNAIGEIKIQEAEKTTLDNGVPVYSVNAGFQDVVKIEMMFHTTTFDAAHPLASSATNRLLSEGSSKHNALQLAEMIDNYGSFYETEESADSCSVVLYTLTKYLDKTLPVFYEIIMDPVFPEHELVTFRQNNRQRLMVENEKVNTVARKKFNEMIFGQDHAYGYFVSPVDYEKLNRETLVQYHRKNYHAGNCSFFVSGKISSNVIASLNTIFGNYLSEKTVEQKVLSSSFQVANEKKIVIEKEGAVQSAIRIGKLLFNKMHPDYIGMTVLSTALGGYFGSRLMSNIREDKGYTYGIGSAVVSMKQAGCFFISTEVDADVTGLALEEIYYEIERLMKEPLEKNELSMVKNFMTGSFLKGIDGAFHLADRRKSLLMYGLNYDYYYRYLETIKNITAGELMELAKKHFKLNDFYEIILGKK